MLVALVVPLQGPRKGPGGLGSEPSSRLRASPRQHLTTLSLSFLACNWGDNCHHLPTRP